MPKVLLDLRMVRGRLHGIARYALELAQRLPGLRPGWSFVGLTPPEGLEGLGSLTPAIPLEPCAAGFLSPLEQPALAASLLRLRCDLFHATSFSVPLLWPGPLVATLHDATHLALEENFGPATRLYYRFVVGPRVRRARAVLTDSEFSRGELARYLGLQRSRIEVTPLAADGRFRPPSGEEATSFRKRFDLPEAYFAVVGNGKPHKNLGLLARIAAQLPCPLVLLAGSGVAQQLGFPSGTRELDNLSDADLVTFYGAATALLLPSRYEGFGLPALEAMASGCPVVSSNAASLPEVVGDAGVLLSPEDEAAWVDTASRVLRDGAFRHSLRQRGLERAAHFSWEVCAQETLAAYERALATP